MKSLKITCPCCQNKVGKDRMKYIFSLLPVDGQVLHPQKSLEDSFMEIQSKWNMYQWACDRCIKSGDAILANPQKQFYKFTYPWDTASPYLAYYNKRHKCRQCKKKFNFTKEEQLYWYETLGFVVYSVPRECKECRREKSYPKKLNTELSELLRNGSPQDLEKLKRIVEIYREIDKPEKEKKYLAAIRKIERRAN